MRPLVGLAFAAVCTLVSTSAAAQTCAGGGSFAQSPVQLGFDVTLLSGASGYHATLGVGGKNVFGGAAVAVLGIENADQKAKGLVLFGGAELGGHRVFVCPIADVEFMRLPDIANVKVTGTGIAVGGRGGIVAVDGPIRVIPTVGYFRSHETLTGTTETSQGSESRNFGLFEFGVGFPGRRVGFGTTVVVPVGDPGASNQLRVGITFLF